MNSKLTRTVKALMAGSYALLLSSVAVNAQWTTVGPNATVSQGAASYQNLVKDNAGNYYVSYYDAVSGVQKGSVRKFNGTSWSYLGSQGITGGIATYNSLAVNASGEVFYSYQDGANSSKYP